MPEIRKLLASAHARVLLPLALLCFGLSGCGTFNDGNAAKDMLCVGNFTPFSSKGKNFDLQGSLRPGEGDVLHVYIEGDGRSWESRTRISRDPTPSDPVGFRLAEADKTRNPVLYLARPGQYLSEQELKSCSPKYWTSARLCKEVISDINLAIDKAKTESAARRVAIFGFSGGGGAAVLAAAERRDVTFIGTVAGNLDHEFWTGLHKVSPLNESLNPIDVAQKLRNIPQVHISGGVDKIVPPEIASRFCRASASPKVKQKVIPRAAHGGPWKGENNVSLWGAALDAS